MEELATSVMLLSPRPVGRTVQTLINQTDHVPSRENEIHHLRYPLMQSNVGTPSRTINSTDGAPSGVHGDVLPVVKISNGTINTVWRSVTHELGPGPMSLAVY